MTRITREDPPVLRNLLAVAIICSNLGCAAVAQTPEPDRKGSPVNRILVLEMTVQGPVHRINSARVVDSSTSLKAAHQTAPTDLQYEVTDTEEQSLFSGSFDDPRILRGVFPPADEPQTGHPVLQLESTEYVLRVPYSSRARYLKLRPAPATANSSAASKTATPVQTFDLAPLLNSASKL
jgi:hypothetical protein